MKNLKVLTNHAQGLVRLLETSYAILARALRRTLIQPPGQATDTKELESMNLEFSQKPVFKLPCVRYIELEVP